VNGEQVKLKHPMSKQRKASRRSRSCSVKLRLEPVGALVRITGTAQLRSLVSCILTILKHIHEHDFVHRDIRLNNVVRVTNGWLLIDWELAGRTKQLVWWEGKLLPDGVKHRIEPYTCKTDLWQLGMLIKTAAVCADVAITSFADLLLAGGFATAALAQASLWFVDVRTI
jgi:serine/threonine protein kinase